MTQENAQAVTIPSARMIAAVTAAATRRGESAPAGFEQDFAVAQAFLQRGDGNAQSAVDAVGVRYARAAEYINEHGVSIQHFRTTGYEFGEFVTDQFGGLTAAFKAEGNYLKIATAVCAEQDTFNRKIGAALAVERLANNQAILVPMHEDAHAIVQNMFAGLYEPELTGEYNEPVSCRPGLGMSFFPFGHPMLLRIRHGVPAAKPAAQPEDFVELAAYVIPEGEGDAQLYNANARVLLAATLGVLEARGERTEAMLKYVLTDAPEDELVAMLAGTRAEPLTASAKLLSTSRAIAIRYLSLPLVEGEADGLAGFPGLADVLGSLRRVVPASTDELLKTLRGSPQGRAAEAFIHSLFAGAKK
jgi:Type IV secretion-system coupling protein DNA-binding domain